MAKGLVNDTTLRDIADAIRDKKGLHIVPKGYTLVDYIENSGTQYIDTGWVNGTNYDVNLRIAIPSTGHRYCLLSSYYDKGDVSLELTGDSYPRMYTTTGGNIALNQIIPTNTITEIMYNFTSGFRKITMNEKSTSTNSGYQTGTKSAYLFVDRDLRFETFGSFKLYGCVIKQNGVKVRDFVPCYRDSDNEVGLYDVVNDAFYTNQGTGTFNYGSEVEPYYLLPSEMPQAIASL